MISLSDFIYADTRLYILSGGFPTVVSNIKPLPAVLLGAGLGAAFVIQHQLQMNTIWQNDAPFKFKDDALEEM